MEELFGVKARSEPLVNDLEGFAIFEIALEGGDAELVGVPGGGGHGYGFAKRKSFYKIYKSYMLDQLGTRR